MGFRNRLFGTLILLGGLAAGCALPPYAPGATATAPEVTPTFLAGADATPQGGAGATPQVGAGATPQGGADATPQGGADATLETVRTGRPAPTATLADNQATATAVSTPTRIAPAPPEPTPTPPAGLPEVDAILTELGRAGSFQGAVLVARQGTLLLEKGYGLADADSATPITPKTRFRIASLTKQFTAMAILMLESEGKLQVSQLLCSFVKDCPKAWQAITLEELLTHTSGVPDLFSFPDVMSRLKTQQTPQDLVDWLQTRPLDFTPGKMYYYSNSGYVLLAYVIQQVSGKSYADFLQEHIFGPLGMADSGVDDGHKGVATGYQNAFVKASPINLSILVGAGDLYSSAEDLYRWDQALYGETLLPQAEIQKLFVPRVQKPNSSVSYGYGWDIDSYAGRRLVAHYGMIDGFTAYIGRFPEEQVTVIILSNRGDLTPGNTNSQIFGLLFP